MARVKPKQYDKSKEMMQILELTKKLSGKLRFIEAYNGGLSNREFLELVSNMRSELLKFYDKYESSPQIIEAKNITEKYDNRRMDK